MTTPYRVLFSAVIGLTLAGGFTVACAIPHSIDGYITEVRGEMPDYDSRSTSDDQIVNTGRAMCSYPESFDSIGSTENDATPEQQERTDTFLATTKGYCDVLGTGPLPSAPQTDYAAGDYSTAADTAPVTTPPVPIAVGKPIALNYGGDDISTTTITGVTRCDQHIVLDVTLKASDFYAPGQDAVAQTLDYVDTDGVTKTLTNSYLYPDCGNSDPLPSAYEQKPGKTYKGYVSYEIPKGKGTTLNLYGSDGVTRTLDITGK